MYEYQLNKSVSAVETHIIYLVKFDLFYLFPRIY